jgi:translation elongation factor EF-4
LQTQIAGEAERRQKRMKSIGNVNIPQEAFIEVLKA